MTLQATPQTDGHAGMDRTDSAGLLILDRDQCLDILARGGRGRIAISVGALPAILPVRFGLVGDQVVLCVAVGGTLDRATRDVVVAFEADGSGVYGEWSVSVIGVARELTNVDALKRAEELTLPTWSAREYRFVAISTDHISGRRVVPCPSHTALSPSSERTPARRC